MGMTENEILQNAIQAAQAATSLFGVFLTIVSAYVVGLYLFLNRAGLSLRLFAFFLLSLSLAALALLAWNLQYLGEGMHEAWSRLPEKMTGMDTLGPPLIVRNAFMKGGLLVTLTGWVFGSVVYVALAYMTFIYRWPKPDAVRD
jgi:hypothetical protein